MNEAFEEVTKAIEAEGQRAWKEIIAGDPLDDPEAEQVGHHCFVLGFADGAGWMLGEHDGLAAKGAEAIKQGFRERFLGLLVARSQELEVVRCFCCGETAATRTGGPSAEAVGQSHRWEAGVLDVHDSPGSGSCFAAICCWPCFWELEPDLWILPEHWTQAHPQVPLEKLPVLNHEDPKAWEPTHYSWPLSRELGRS